MILRIFLDEFCKLGRERCGHREVKKEKIRENPYHP